MLLGHANELADALPTGDTLHSAGCSLKTAPRATFTLLMAAALAAGSGAEIKLRVPYDSDDRIDEVEVLQDDRWLPVQDLGWTPPSAAEPFAAARRLGAASSGVSGGPETYEPCPGIASGNSTESVAVDDDLRRARASQVRRRDLERLGTSP